MVQNLLYKLGKYSLRSALFILYSYALIFVYTINNIGEDFERTRANPKKDDITSYLVIKFRVP